MSQQTFSAPDQAATKTESASQETTFELGTSKKQTTLAKTKTKTADEIAEQRKQETFNTGTDFGESTKRQREDYAIKLRKQKR